MSVGVYAGGPHTFRTPVRFVDLPRRVGCLTLWMNDDSFSEVTDGTHAGVTLVDGRKGFVNDEEVLTPLGYRLFFERNGGEWLITAFVAGD